MNMLFRFVSCLSISMLFACSEITAPDPIKLPTSDIIYRLSFTTKAVMIVSSDTITLKAIAIFADSSQAIVDPNKVFWRSIDPSIVRVDSAGKIQALVASDLPTEIIGTYTHNGVTKADTIPVYVTSTRIDATDIKIEVLDSTHVGAIALNGTPKIRIDLYKDGIVSKEGVQLPIIARPGIVVSAVPGSLGVFKYQITNSKGALGKFYIYASLNLYGNEVRDSLEFTGLYPASNNLPSIIQNMEGGVSAPTMKPSDPVKYIQPCGIVKFLLLLPLTTKPVDIVFSDSLQSGSETCAPISDADTKPGASPVRANQVWGNVTGIVGPGLVVVVRRSPTVGEVSYYLRDAITKDSLPVSGRYIQK